MEQILCLGALDFEGVHADAQRSGAPLNGTRWILSQGFRAAAGPHLRIGILEELKAPVLTPVRHPESLSGRNKVVMSLEKRLVPDSSAKDPSH